MLTGYTIYILQLSMGCINTIMILVLKIKGKKTLQREEKYLIYHQLSGSPDGLS